MNQTEPTANATTTGAEKPASSPGEETPRRPTLERMNGFRERTVRFDDEPKYEPAFPCGS